MMGPTWEEFLIYFDNLIVFVPAFEDFLEWLEKVFQHLSMANIRLKQSKSIFGYNQVKYLEHIVIKQRVVLDPKKMLAIKKFLIPNTRTSVRGFLELASYF